MYALLGMCFGAAIGAVIDFMTPAKPAGEKPESAPGKPDAASGKPESAPAAAPPALPAPKAPAAS